MSYFKATGIYNAPAAPGADTFAGLTFTPKVVIFWWNLLTANGSAANFDLGMGFATATGTGPQECVSTSSEDANTTSNVDRASSNVKCIYHEKWDGTSALAADFTAFTATGWTLNWTATTSGVDIHYIALGGTDIQVSSGMVNKSTGAAPATQTISGLGFSVPNTTPAFVMCILNDVASDEDASLGQSRYSYGFASSAAARAVLSGQHANAAGTSDCNSAQYTNNFVHIHSGADAVLGDITSFSANQFQITFTTNNGVAYRLRYLAISGINCAVTNFNQPTATGLDSTGGLSFQPDLEMYLSYNAVSSSVINTSGVRMSIGATDGTNQNVLWAGDKDAAAVTIASQNTDTTKLMKLMTEAGAAPTTQASAAFSAFTSGGRTLNWGAVDATARQVIVVSFGAAASLPPSTDYYEPVYGFPATPVTLHGQFYTGTTLVKFSGLSTPFTVVNDTTITTTVPIGATTGLINVTNAAGNANAAQNFIVSTLTTLNVTENDAKTISWTFSPGNEPLIDGFQVQYSTGAQSGPWTGIQNLAPTVRSTPYTVTLPSAFIQVLSYLANPSQTSPVSEVFFLNTTAAPPPPPPPPPPGPTPIALPSLFPFGAIVLTAGVVFSISDYFTGKFSSTITFCTHPLNSASALVYISDKTMLSTGSNAAVTLLGPNQIFKLENRGGLSTLPLSNITLTTNITGSMILLSTQS